MNLYVHLSYWRKFEEIINVILFSGHGSEGATFS
jgi:hypothetical protein